MKRRWLTVIGLLFALTAVAQAVAFLAIGEVRVTEGLNAVLLAAVGLLFVTAGEGYTAGEFEWHQLAGVGFVALGCWAAFQAGMLVPDDPSGIGWVLIVSFVVGGLVFVFIGIDWFRGGHHVDLSHFEPGPLRGEPDRQQGG